ncbi:uncharacterized protein [Spinacia oleracea]|uniref:Retrotransposon gag domain-containing protein n=1 Tax=Spinacia oleracea TaxID=3562 RepID=A0ABM3RQB5_SPIOL|nr:uncharacterized protein LOC130471605 [Spinacia oleracea]
MNAPKEPKVKTPAIDAYEGTSDPDVHLLAYRHHMYVQGTTDATWCKYFPSTLKGVASKWFEKLPAGTINTYAELEMLFSARFMAYKIPDLPDGVAFDNLFRRLKKGSFKFDLVKKSVRTMADALDEAESFIHATEICSVPKESKRTEATDHPQRKDKSDKKTSRPNGTWAIEKKGYEEDRSQGQKRGRPYDKERFEYNTDLYTILLDVSDRYEIDRPFPMKSPVETRDSSLYCKFHCDVGHETKDCKSLRRALDGLAAKGFLKSYLSPSTGGSDDNDTDPEIVAVISGGLAAGGPTMRGQKDYASRLGQGKIATPHDDPLVIELKVANLKVRRILVDTGIPSDIISTACLSRLEHDPKTIEKIHYPIIGFGGGIIHPQGIITLPLRVGGRHQSKNLNARFLIVKDLTAYNIILGRPTLNQAKAVVVTHLMLMKYACDKGQVGIIHGDQQLARDCYLTTLSPEAWGKTDEARASSKRKLDEMEEKVKKDTFTIATAHMETRRPERLVDIMKSSLMKPVQIGRCQ